MSRLTLDLASSRWRALAAGLMVALAGALPADQAAATPRRPGPPPIAGVVTKVIDGDTLVFQPEGQADLTVRLRDIDAPESCQAWGAEARKALQDLALGKAGRLAPHGHDAYGRTVGTLEIDGQNVGKRLVEDGHAWSTRSRWDQGPLVKQERQARALGRGLHATPGAVMPKAFRQAHGPCPRH